MNEFYKYCNDKGITGNLREALYHQLMSEGKTNPTNEEIDRAWKAILNNIAKRIKAQ